jgi:hypothetical protein
MVARGSEPYIDARLILRETGEHTSAWQQQQVAAAAAAAAKPIYTVDIWTLRTFVLKSSLCTLKHSL